MEMLLFLGQSLFYDALILSSVSWVVKKKIPVLIFLTAVGVSFIVSLILFLTVPLFLMVVPLLTVSIAFWPQTLKGYGIITLYFYALSAFLSGILHILRYFMELDRMPIGWFLVFGCVIAVISTVSFMLKSRFFKKVYTLSEFEHQVKLYVGDVVIAGVGFVDTGNALIDQRTQLPVMIVPRRAVENIDDLIENGVIQTWELGFSVVGDEEKKMVAFKPTLLLIDEVIVKGVIVGLCETSFAQYDFLLQPEITVGRGVG
ncbi:MAG: sigma-E processing peptidase SpoIIGA [Defluviitaleaceae bacterium]|nr:sigma-E processing peptidase SpoIIGA [Defluviitaleaceae bacterium]